MLTQGWNSTLQEALYSIVALHAAAGISVVPWPYGNVPSFDRVARSLMQWYQIIIVPSDCDISIGTLNAWRASEMTTAAGTVFARPAVLQSNNRTIWDLAALAPAILLLVYAAATL